jgi:hypothetical protein
MARDFLSRGGELQEASRIIGQMARRVNNANGFVRASIWRHAHLLDHGDFGWRQNNDKQTWKDEENGDDDQ